MVKHRHHKIPLHAGGPDTPDNIEVLSVAEHAEAHRLLFEKHGRIEDKLAWKGLAGLITKAEIVRELQVLGGKKSVAQHQPWANSRTPGNWALNKELQEKATTRAASKQAITKRKQTFNDIAHQQGESNSAYGTSIYRDTEGTRKRFKRGEQPVGWVLSKDWVAERKCKNNPAFGKKWFNDGVNNFLLNPDDDKTRFLKLGRLNPGFQ